jgi:lipopolysaccharide transport system ATP-binding protein
VAILGKNGAGKSTLLKILSRITLPTTGKIKIRGRISSLLEVGTGFHPELTGRENIFLNGAILGMTSREIKRKFDEIVAFAEVEKFLNTPVKRYSSGMYARLGFAIAAHLDPDLLIVDEVLAVGDAQFQAKCLKKMNDLGTQGRTVLFVSHDIRNVIALCNKGILLEKGQLAMTGPIADCVNRYMKSTGSEQFSWKGDFGDEHIRIKSFSLPNDKEYFIRDETAQLTLEYEVVKPHPDLIFGIMITNRRGLLVARSHIADDWQNLNKFTVPGSHKATFSIDTSIFNDGEYTVHLDCSLYGQKLIHHEDLKLKFPILSANKNTRFKQLGELEGVFLGNFWKHEKK